MTSTLGIKRPLFVTPFSACFIFFFFLLEKQKYRRIYRKSTKGRFPNHFNLTETRLTGQPQRSLLPCLARGWSDAASRCCSSGFLRLASEKLCAVRYCSGLKRVVKVESVERGPSVKRLRRSAEKGGCLRGKWVRKSVVRCPMLLPLGCRTTSRSATTPRSA